MVLKSNSPLANCALEKLSVHWDTGFPHPTAQVDCGFCNLCIRKSTQSSYSLVEPPCSFVNAESQGVSLQKHQLRYNNWNIRNLEGDHPSIFHQFWGILVASQCNLLGQRGLGLLVKSFFVHHFELWDTILLGIRPECIMIYLLVAHWMLMLTLRFINHNQPVENWSRGKMGNHKRFCNQDFVAKRPRLAKL
jgi:hypothetical protein